MSKIITLLFILLVSDCKAATGDASDGPLLAVVVIGLVLLIVGTGYFIDFIKSKYKELRMRRLIKKDNIDQDTDFLNSFNKVIPESDFASTY